MGDIRKKYTPSFKIKVAAEAICGQATLAQLSSKYGVHPSLISKWKGQAQEELLSWFSKNGKSLKEQGDAEFKRLQMRLNKLSIENEFLTRCFEKLETSKKKP
ncbi:MAG: transposase [Deltaproteobacteria bacterium]|nr:transposase [Deltaproteobacteria bacterium]